MSPAIKHYSNGAMSSRITSLPVYGFGTPLVRAIYGALRLEHEEGPVRLLDAMAGEFARLGVELRHLHAATPKGQELDLTANDVRRDAIDVLLQNGLITLHCDVREIGSLAPGTFERVTERFGIKDLRRGQAELAIESLFQALRPGGVVAVAAPTARTSQGQRGINAMHAAKQILAGTLDRTRPWPA